MKAGAAKKSRKEKTRVTDFRQDLDLELVLASAVGPAELVPLEVDDDGVGHPDHRVDGDASVRSVEGGRLDPGVGRVPVGPVNPAETLSSKLYYS